MRLLAKITRQIISRFRPKHFIWLLSLMLPATQFASAQNVGTPTLVGTELDGSALLALDDGYLVIDERINTTTPTETTNLMYLTPTSPQPKMSSSIRIGDLQMGYQSELITTTDSRNHLKANNNSASGADEASSYSIFIKMSPIISTTILDNGKRVIKLFHSIGQLMQYQSVEPDKIGFWINKNISWRNYLKCK